MGSAHEDLKTDKEIVLAAVQQSGSALCSVHPDLKSDREVVLVAVRQAGEALKSAHEDLKSDKEIVLVATENNEEAFKHASDPLRTEIELSAAQAGLGIAEYAHAVLHPVVVQVQSTERISGGIVRVHMSTLAGTADTVDVDIDLLGNTTAAFRAQLAARWGVCAAALSIVLESGRLCQIGSEACLV